MSQWWQAPTGRDRLGVLSSTSGRKRHGCSSDLVLLYTSSLVPIDDVRRAVEATIFRIDSLNTVRTYMAAVNYSFISCTSSSTFFHSAGLRSSSGIVLSLDGAMIIIALPLSRQSASATTNRQVLTSCDTYVPRDR